eukprot:CAMPEP_0115258592 /NCGR_PEP_ID=MMETSP0270-20121206/47377_1 /TAXON_ID=71861 /ORGANISM="Scrippsiella trochoidea, Strain CCMP3099" /LENGTH=241 /DNA_ID=CAMNT_0002674353 /DNA_START=226 /DNA_END=949 /DNA_ORIENTATION=+
MVMKLMEKHQAIVPPVHNTTLDARICEGEGSFVINEVDDFDLRARPMPGVECVRDPLGCANLVGIAVPSSCDELEFAKELALGSPRVLQHAKDSADFIVVGVPEMLRCPSVSEHPVQAKKQPHAPQANKLPKVPAMMEGTSRANRSSASSAASLQLLPFELPFEQLLSIELSFEQLLPFEQLTLQFCSARHVALSHPEPHSAATLQSSISINIGKNAGPTAEAAGNIAGARDVIATIKANG